MKITTVFKHLYPFEPYLCCPLCHTSVTLKEPSSITCKNNHCFDVSSMNYINFIPHQKPTSYTKELFKSRRIVLESLYYDELVTEILNQIQMFNNPVILDVGCGEGYYSRIIKERCKSMVLGFDNCKEAIQLAGKSSLDIAWLMADLTNIPLLNQSVDVVLDVLTPSNYTEFSRILKNQGCLIKVIPGEFYLKEFRQLLNQNNDNYSIEPVLEHMKSKMNVTEVKKITYKKTCKDDHYKHFAKMTPLMFNKEIKEELLQELSEVTFDFVVIIARKD